jgi:hypothetical protein
MEGIESDRHEDHRPHGRDFGVVANMIADVNTWQLQFFEV